MNSLTHFELAPAAAIFGLVIALTACDSTPSRFYTLSAAPSVATELANPTGSRQGVVGVGPIEIPKYLDRGQIVTFTDPYQMKLAEFDRWAEPLGNNFARVMAEDLFIKTSAARVEIYPFPVNPRNPSIRQVVVQIIRFHKRSDGVIDLWANWSILDQEGRRNLASGTSRKTETSTAGDYQSIAAAMSRAVSSFSDDVARALNALPPPTS